MWQWWWVFSLHHTMTQKSTTTIYKACSLPQWQSGCQQKWWSVYSLSAMKFREKGDDLFLHGSSTAWIHFMLSTINRDELEVIFLYFYAVNKSTVPMTFVSFSSSLLYPFSCSCLYLYGIRKICTVSPLSRRRESGCCVFYYFPFCTPFCRSPRLNPNVYFR